MSKKIHKSHDGFVIPKKKPCKFWKHDKHSFPAQQQGWDLFDVWGGANDGELQIQVIQDPQSIPGIRYKKQKFKDDEAAAAFVEQQAVDGNTICQAAIRELRYQKMPEVKRFKLDKRIKTWKKPTEKIMKSR